jgi:hypothetical protein
MPSTELLESYNSNMELPKNSPLKISTQTILPGAILLSALTVDYFGLLGFNITPMTCVISIFIFARFIGYRKTLFWAPIYIFCSIIVLWGSQARWQAGRGNVHAMLTSRTVTATIACSMACILAGLRERQANSVKQIESVLDRLSIATITSDQDGWITHLNTSAMPFLDNGIALGEPYFAYFRDISQKGKSIQRYLDLVTGKIQGPVAMDLTFSSQKDRIFPALLIPLAVNNKRFILTVIYPSTDERNKGIDI